jgi:hypothetical protein
MRSAGKNAAFSHSILAAKIWIALMLFPIRHSPFATRLEHGGEN